MAPANLETDEQPFVRTTVARMMLALMRETHEQRGITVISGPYGIGKTTAIDEFVNDQVTNCVVVKVQSGLLSHGASVGHVLQSVIDALTIKIGLEDRFTSRTMWTLKHKVNNLIERYFGWQHWSERDRPRFTFIFDEAQFLSPSAIEMLRFWNDRDRTATPIPVGLVFIGNNDFALDESRPGGSVLSGAVRSRLLYEEKLTYGHLSDGDLVSFCQSRGINDEDAIAELVAFYRLPRVSRDLRNVERQIRQMKSFAGADAVTLQTVKQLLAA